MHAAVAHVHAVDNGITYRCAALDDSPAHDRYVAIEALPDNAADYHRLQGLIDRTRPVLPVAKLQENVVMPASDHAKAPAYKVKHVVPVINGSDVQARVFTLAPGEAIPAALSPAKH